MNRDRDPYRFVDADGQASLAEDWLGHYCPPDRPPILSPRRIRRLAFDRERLLWSIGLVVLATAALVAALVAEKRGLFPGNGADLVPWIAIGYYLLHLPAVVFVFRVAAVSWSWLMVVVFAGSACMPMLDFIVALTVFVECRDVLERHGIPVGLFTIDRRFLPGPKAVWPSADMAGSGVR